MLTNDFLRDGRSENPLATEPTSFKIQLIINDIRLSGTTWG